METDRGRSSVCWVTFPIAGARSQEPGVQAEYSVLGAGAEAVGLSFTAFKDTLVGSWIKSRTARIEMGTLMWDKGIARGSLNLLP